jgi:hypothetical protein
MIDHEKERLLSMTEASKLLPGRPNVATLWRWRTTGCRGIKLESMLSGGRRYTSVEALRRFLEQVTEAADGPFIRPRTSQQRESDIRRAEKELSEAGW